MRPGPAPKSFADALARCAPLFIDTPNLDVSRGAHRAFFTSDEVQRDFAGALTVIDLSDDDSYGEHELEPELVWSCVGRAVSEAGFPCTVEWSGDVVAFWPEEEA